MTSYPRKLLPLCIAAALFAARAEAIGVGDIRLASYLGKPLQAEVALTDTGALSADQIRVRLGSEADYAAMGVEYNYLHTQLTLEPFLRDGRGYVRISTREPIAEPYLNFVLSVQWPQGQVVREFTVLLDPAPLAAVAAAPKPAAAPEAGAQAPAPIAAGERAPVRPVAAVPREGSYTVQRGDSLWRIASKLQPGDASLEQTMNAIVARNPQAFINGDPNRLKEAARIEMPDAAEIAAANGALPATRATAAIDSPTPAAAAAAAAATQATRAATASEEALVEENAALKAQVAELSGNVEALNRSLGQSEQRLHDLEGQLDNVLRQIQQQRDTVAALSGAPARAAAPAAGGGSVINQVNAAELRPGAPLRTPWWVHLLYWLGIGGAVTWAIREHFWPQRRLATLTAGEAPLQRAAAEPRVRPSFAPLAIEDLPQLAPAPAAGDEVVAGEEIEALVAAGQSEPPQLEPRPFDDPVDASISAGVFIAFGRFDEAERLLRDAIAQVPERVDLQLQLLDVYLQSDQRDSFEALARAIESGPTTPEILAELAVLRESYGSR